MGSCVARLGLLGRRALAYGDADASGHRLPLSRTLEKVLMCCPQAGLPTFPTGGIPLSGTRGKDFYRVQIGGQESRVEVTLDRPDATGTHMPALPQRLGHTLTAAMTELREFGRACGDFEQDAARAATVRRSISRNIPGARSPTLLPNCCGLARYEIFSVMMVLPTATIS